MVTESSQNTLPTPRYYLVDGFHRVAAAKQAGITELPFIEKSGTYREALLFSLGVNSIHGLRRSNEDKRKAVFTLLNDEEWSQWSNRVIAKQCQVSASLVDKLRNEFFNKCNLTANKSSGNQENNKCNLTANKSSGNQENNNSNLTANKSSGNQENDESNLTGNIASGNQESNAEVTRTYVTKDGVEAKMRVGNIGQSGVWTRYGYCWRK
jgi:hypothetical protein